MKTRRVFRFIVSLLSISIANGSIYVPTKIDSLYHVYKVIQDAVMSQPELIFEIKQAFFPVMNYRYWQVDGAEVIPIKICLTIQGKKETSMLINALNTTTADLLMNFTTCWNFQWTNSLLLNLIPGDILVAMDPAFTCMLYSNVVESFQNRWLHLNLHLKREVLHSDVSQEDYEQALVLFLASVSILAINIKFENIEGTNYYAACLSEQLPSSKFKP